MYSAKLRNPTQVATMTTALDLGVNRRSEVSRLHKTVQVAHSAGKLTKTEVNGKEDS